MSKHVGPPTFGTFTTADVPLVGERVRYDDPGKRYSGSSGVVVDLLAVVRLDSGVQIRRTYTKFEKP